MGLFIDSSFFIALINTRDKYHPKAISLLKSISHLGTRYTSDYVLDEVITTLWKTTHDKKIVRNAYTMINEKEKFVKLIKITKDTIEDAWKKWNKNATWPKKPLSFTDCTILATMEEYSISYILTFDNEFEGLIEVIR